LEGERIYRRGRGGDAEVAEKMDGEEGEEKKAA